MNNFRRRTYAPRNAMAYAPSGMNYNPQKMNFTSDEFDFLKAYLNGCHDNNFQRCPGAPNNSGLQTIEKHFVASTTVIPNATGFISLAITGIPEAPIIDVDTTANTARVICYNNLPAIATNGTPTAPSDFFKTHGIGAYRCTSLAVKIIDETPAMVVAGTIMAARNPAPFDDVAIDIPYNDAVYAAAHRGYARVYDSIPTQDSDITSMSNSSYINKSAEGLYATLPSIDPEMNFIQRQDEHSKATYSAATTSAFNAIVHYLATPVAYKVSTGTNVYAPIAANVRSTTLTGYTSIGMVPCHPSNMIGLSVLGTGLVTGSTVWRVSVYSSWEFIAGFNCDWTESARVPMHTNLNILRAASTTFANMPDAYPAAANFWNEIWDKFKDVYKSINPALTKVISSLPPEYSAPANSVKTMIDKLTDATEKTNELVKKVIVEHKADKSDKQIQLLPQQRRK